MVLFFEKALQKELKQFFIKSRRDTGFAISELVRSTFFAGINKVSKYSFPSQTGNQMKA